MHRKISESDENIDSDSDVSMTTDSDSDSESVDSDEVQHDVNESNNQSSSEEKAEDDGDEEEEDEVIKAIKREKEKTRDHPPNIICEDHIVRINFHPAESLLAIALITGDVLMYQYADEENKLVDTYELHLKSCRDVTFDAEGRVLYSTAKDRAVMLTDVATGKLVRCYEDSHEAPVYCVRVLDENLFATGDDDGVIKLWDVRQKQDKSIFSAKKNEDYISDMIADEDRKTLMCSSGDGSLTTIDLAKMQVRMQSEEYDEELTSLGLFRSESKLVAGTSRGKLLLFNWSEFGLHSDEFPGPRSAINGLVPVTEHIVVTACEDGVLRATHLFPHRHLGVVGQHDLSAECVDIDGAGRLIASCSHDNDVRFWNIRYFEGFDTLSHKTRHDKKKDLRNNLPSSKRRNAADFFADLG